MSFTTQAQANPIIRSFDASCSGVCNGSIEILDYRISPERSYYWRTATESSYRLLESNVLTDICAGKYWIRQVDLDYQKLENIAILRIVLDNFELMSEYEFTSKEKKELTLYFSFDREIEYLSYNTRAEYSLDGGLTWKTSSQLNQKSITDLAGNSIKQYLLKLPKSTSDHEKVKVRVYRRKKMTNSAKGATPLSITSSNLESKLISEVVIRLKAQEPMNIRSTVSNEADGEDGYISLDISGGQAPYKSTWSDGVSALQRAQLSAGDYSVTVEDDKGCMQTVDFTLLPPAGQELSQDFTLTALHSSGLYRLEIIGLYRQPLELVIMSSDHVEAKRFKINPLYIDLNMELDLTFLQSGSYSATLSTSGFSKKSNFLIP